MIKGMYKKATIILITFFVMESVFIAILYKEMIAGKVLNDINKEVNKRAYILRSVSNTIQKSIKENKDITEVLSLHKEKYDIDFEFKKPNGDIIFSTILNPLIKNNRIQEQTFIKIAPKINYTLYIYFPTKIGEVDGLNSEKNSIIIYTLILIAFSLFALILIYKLITNPLKNLSKAVEEINYGNTEIKIPYYGEDEFGMLCRNFEDMGRRLKASEESQKQLIQAISHDIKTPLTSILGYSKRLIENKVKDDKIKDYYEVIHKKATDLESLVRELEDYSDINSVEKLNRNILDVEKFLNDISEDIKKEILDKEVEIDIKYDVQEKTFIDIDYSKILRVFENILANSLKYGGNPLYVGISCTKDKGSLYFLIKDNGVGISKDNVEKVFERFYRADTSRSRDKGGTGLGLTICKEIIEAHGGEIGADSKINNGFVIWFRIPVYNDKM